MLRDQSVSEAFVAEMQHESISMLKDRLILPKGRKSSTTLKSQAVSALTFSMFVVLPSKTPFCKGTVTKML